MKKSFIIIILFSLAVLNGLSQEVFENVHSSISTNADTLVIYYDLSGSEPVIDLQLVVVDPLGQHLNVRHFEGDAGNKLIYPGKGKQVVWDLKNDGYDLQGAKVFVQLQGMLQVPVVHKNRLSPLLYMAGTISLGTSAYNYYQSEVEYNRYILASTTEDAEQMHTNIRQYQSVGKIAGMMAGGLFLSGIVVQIVHRHISKNAFIALSPLNNGAELSLTYNFGT